MNSISSSMISGSALLSSTSWDIDSIILAGGEETGEDAHIQTEHSFLHLSIRALGLNLYDHNFGWVCFPLLVNMRLKKWLAAANTTLWAGKCFP